MDMFDNETTLLKLIEDAVIDQASGQDIADAHVHALWLALDPLVKKQAKLVMSGKPEGLNINDWQMLASAGLLHLMEPPGMRILGFKGRSSGELAGFVKEVLVNLYRDDRRRLTGRLPSQKATQAQNAWQGDEDTFPEGQRAGDNAQSAVENPTQMTYKQQVRKALANSPAVPRVYEDVVDEEGNEFLVSHRRTATGYLLLKQTKAYLHIYLRQMPGLKIVLPQLQGARGKISLKVHHADLLRIWMSGEGENSWADLSKQMGTPEGTLRRWWAQAVLAFEVDVSQEAQALRRLYRLNPTHLAVARELVAEA